ncbi:DUF2569 domain-containing protein [Desulfatitalea tepidiphila]|uniref:DUF2569 domain-containing protein n=1 Tax=Desulfatitalea tepidiphila TaxID=1185843 RepID=UPI0006B53C51|nr:DUF2569 domain-containing protein [Desulfatitalea tepidiphila]
MDCPNCGLANSESALRCDCGYDFQSGQIAEPYLNNPTERLNSIGGWLILPAAGLIIGPIITVIKLIPFLKILPDVIGEDIAVPFAFILILLLSGVIFMIYTATLFFRKKRKTPRIFINMLIFILCIIFIELAILYIIGDKWSLADFGRDMIGSIIGTIIWIRYFQVSKRVKATFIN